MRISNYIGFICLMVFAACQKPIPSEEGKQSKTITSVQETYQGKTARFFLTYNNLKRLSVYESEDKKFKAQYRYEHGKPQWISFKMDTITYELVLNYTDAGMGNSLLRVSWENGKIKEEPIAVTNSDGEVELHFFNGLYSCLLKNENLINASFHAWYYKRKLNINYGTDPGPTFGMNTILPKGELNNPLVPDSQIYTTIFHMLLSAFSKNRVMSINSDLYNRTFEYEKDQNGRISSVVINAVKIVEGGYEALDAKRITYSY